MEKYDIEKEKLGNERLETALEKHHKEMSILLSEKQDLNPN